MKGNELMKKFKKQGAAALAVAIALTAVPTMPVAAASDNIIYTNHRYSSNSDTLVNRDTDVIAKFDEYNADGTYFGTSGVKAWAIANGYATALTSDQYYSGDYDDNYSWSQETYNPTTDSYTYTYYILPAGYTINWRDYNGKEVITLEARTYTNVLTGKSFTNYDDAAGLSNDKEREALQIASTVYVPAKETSYLCIELINGDTSIKNIKSSKKKIIKASSTKKYGYSHTTAYTNSDPTYKWGNGKVNYQKDETVVDNKDGAYHPYYYVNSLGKRVYFTDYNSLTQSVSDSAAYQASSSDSANVYIQINAKKAGKSKVSFDIYNKNGQKIGKKTITVIAQDVDNNLFKTFTYGKTSLVEQTYGDEKYINTGKSMNAHDFNVVNQKSAKLKIKTTNRYTVKQILVGKLSRTTDLTSKNFDMTVDTSANTYTEKDEYYTYSKNTTQTGSTTTYAQDLNGDGDILDMINGANESSVSYKFTKVKNGKKIKLSTVGTRKGTNTTTTVNAYNYTDGRSNSTTYTSTSTSTSTYAPTVIRVIYYDKIAKCNYSTDYTIYTKAK